MIDNDVIELINDTYDYSLFIVENTKDLIIECAEILKQTKLLKAEQIRDIINQKYKHLNLMFSNNSI